MVRVADSRCGGARSHERGIRDVNMVDERGEGGYSGRLGHHLTEQAWLTGCPKRETMATVG